jgi:hypothetical protein
MRTGVLLLSLSFLSLTGPAQENPHFYNVDTEMSIEGKVEKIILEPRYEDTANFLILIIRNRDGRDYVCEISPSWFFSKDFHKGEHLTLVGSFYLDQQGRSHLIARQLKFQGELMILRDKNGFPSWRGGKGKGESMRRRKRY